MEDVELDYVNSEVVEEEKKGTDNREKPDAGIRVYRVVGVSFGLLCVLQASLNISLRLLAYKFSDHDLPSNASLPASDDVTALVGQMHQLQTRYNQSQASNNALTKERDRLQTSYEVCVERLEMGMTPGGLLDLYNTLAIDRDSLRDKVSQLSNEKKALQEEVDRLRGRPLPPTRIVNALRTQSCPTEWSSHQSSCYLVPSEQKSWEEAKQDCLQRGAHLAVINSREEQVALHSIPGTPDGRVWIGLTDADTEGIWTWVDGTPLTVQYWAGSQPDNRRRVTDEDCVYTDRHLTSVMASWSDAPCNLPLHWMCEKAIK